MDPCEEGVDLLSSGKRALHTDIWEEAVDLADLANPDEMGVVVHGDVVAACATVWTLTSST